MVFQKDVIVNEWKSIFSLVDLYQSFISFYSGLFLRKCKQKINSLEKL